MDETDTARSPAEAHEPALFEIASSAADTNNPSQREKLSAALQGVAMTAACYLFAHAAGDVPGVLDLAPPTQTVAQQHISPPQGAANIVSNLSNLAIPRQSRAHRPIADCVWTQVSAGAASPTGNWGKKPNSTSGRAVCAGS